MIIGDTNEKEYINKCDSVIVVLSLGILVFVALINKSEFNYKEAKKKAEEF